MTESSLKSKENTQNKKKLTNKVDQLPSEHGNHMVMLRLSQAFVDDEHHDLLQQQLLKDLNLSDGSKNKIFMNQLGSGNLALSKENEK